MVTKFLLYPAAVLFLLATSFTANAVYPCSPWPACSSSNGEISDPHDAAGSLFIEGFIKATLGNVWNKADMDNASGWFGSDRQSNLGTTGVAGNGMRYTGMAAGDSFAFPYAIWGNFSYTDASSDFSTTAFDSSRYNVFVGADFSPREGLVMGLALGYEDNEIDTFFNAGEMDVDGYTVVPYVALQVGDQSSLDLAFGYSDLDTSQFRLTGGVPGGARINSKVGSERYFVSANYNTFRDYGEWHVTSQLGVFWAKDQHDAFTESNGTVNGRTSFKLGQAKIGAEVARAWGAFEPYASATLEYDFARTGLPFAAGVARPQYDPTDVLFGFGVRYFADNGLSGSVGYSRIFGRENYDESTLQLLIRAEF